VGHTIDLLEICGFEVHDVKAWREHYGLTNRHWYRGLMARKEEASNFVGMERFRLWALYLAGVFTGIADGSILSARLLRPNIHPREPLEPTPLGGWRLSTWVL
jgi:cyclopropane fatty-acyl-phospholipid synthase-like methyltransferase